MLLLRHNSLTLHLYTITSYTCLEAIGVPRCKQIVSSDCDNSLRKRGPVDLTMLETVPLYSRYCQAWAKFFVSSASINVDLTYGGSDAGGRLR